MIAQRPIERTVPPTHVMGIARFERFFRAAAGLDVDKEDLKRYADFINRKIRDLLISGEAVARTRMVVTSSSLLIFRSPKVMQEKHRQVPRK